MASAMMMAGMPTSKAMKAIQPANLPYRSSTQSESRADDLGNEHIEGFHPCRLAGYVEGRLWWTLQSIAGA